MIPQRFLRQLVFLGLTMLCVASPWLFGQESPPEPNAYLQETPLREELLQQVALGGYPWPLYEYLPQDAFETHRDIQVWRDAAKFGREWEIADGQQLRNRLLNNGVTYVWSLLTFNQEPWRYGFNEGEGEIRVRLQRGGGWLPQYVFFLSINARASGEITLYYSDPPGDRSEFDPAARRPFPLKTATIPAPHHYQALQELVEDLQIETLPWDDSSGGFDTSPLNFEVRADAGHRILYFSEAGSGPTDRTPSGLVTTDAYRALANYCFAIQKEIVDP